MLRTPSRSRNAAGRRIAGAVEFESACLAIIPERSACRGHGLPVAISASATVGANVAVQNPVEIHTMPPTIPMMKLTAPNRMDSVRPSLSASPAYENAAIMPLSRTPHPAIDIGTVALNSTGGIRKRTCANPTGTATALAQHQAALIVKK